MKNPWIIIGVITVILFGGAIWLSGASSEQNNEGVELTEHIKGNPESSVTLTEFSDLQCPACASFQPVIKELLSLHGDNLRLEFKHFPLPARIHPHAFEAAIAAEAAGQQDKFFEFHDLLFERQQEWSGATIPSIHFEKYAEELGLDIDTFRRHTKSSLLKERVQADLAEGNKLGVSGTPAFFLNGKRMEYQSFQEFIQQIVVAVDPTAAASSTEATKSAPAVRFGL